ncbi:hypothetical protein Tco_1542314 [Tanacetum coccineum]
MKNDPKLQQQDIAIWLALQMKFENLQVPQTTCRTSAIRPRDQDDPHDDSHPERENRAKRKEILVSQHPQKTTPLVQSYQRDPEAPSLSLINQDLLYLKKEVRGLRRSYCHFTSFLQLSLMLMILKNELPDG